MLSFVLFFFLKQKITSLLLVQFRQGEYCFKESMNEIKRVIGSHTVQQGSANIPALNPQMPVLINPDLEPCRGKSSWGEVR